MMKFIASGNLATKPHSFEIVTTIDDILYGCSLYQYNFDRTKVLPMCPNP